MILTTLLGLSPKARQLAGARKGGFNRRRKQRDEADRKVLAVLQGGPAQATAIADRTGYKGYEGIARQLRSMVKRELIEKEGRLYRPSE